MSAILTGVVVWRGDKFAKVTGAIMTKRLDKAGAMLQEAIKRNLSQQYPPASKPGQFPARRTGRLQRSIKRRFVGGKTIRIGTINREDAFYAVDLELGSSTVAARPFIRPSVYHNADRVQNIMGAKVNFGGSDG